MTRSALSETIFLKKEPCFAPDTGWCTDETNTPYLMFTTKNGFDGNNLLRGELLTIVGAMRSRMSVDIFATPKSP